MASRLRVFSPQSASFTSPLSFRFPAQRSGISFLSRLSIMNMSTSHATQSKGALKVGTNLVGQTGILYCIDQVLQHRTEPHLSCVYLATTQDGKKHVIKDIYSTEFEYQWGLQAPLAGCPNLRVAKDTVPEHLLFIYDFLTEDLLGLARRDSLSCTARKRILRDSLTGLAALHERGILHGDIKPNNIFVDCDLVDGTIKVERAQIGDLEMGSMIPPGLNVRGARLGNPMWRSPESHAAARINTPSDVFSFGLVCIYTMLHKNIFYIEERDVGVYEKDRIIAKRLLSHFGDGPGLVRFLQHLEDDSAEWRDIVVAVADGFTPEDPRKPLSMWEDVDEPFRDIVAKMTSLDPARRITAKDALEHPWFNHI
ncbi:CMGC/CDK protein kinase [Trichophyton equinum CBS 127.97]|uniref:CMGC/CDK protein kinase n=1 Tax=Trichophyton equinum (strain ATCC MYA-4606 / CBS 127.97) TaxID=559882 RepID=F2Q1M3_TRIEC|nr:CMGC/CDK protein kinase [Trichophyton equinum CBS 127.97]